MRQKKIRKNEDVEQLLQPYKSFVMVCAEIPSTNHAKPSLRSGADLKVKLMLG